MRKGFVWDIEATNLLDSSSIDYTASPYVLKDSFKIHCIVAVDKETKEVVCFYDGEHIELDGRPHLAEADGNKYELKNYTPQEYVRKEIKDFPKWVEENCEGKEIIAHNQINYDLLVCKLFFGMEYSVEKDTWMDREVVFEDTLVLSKTLNPDRFGGHSLDSLSEKTGVRKIDFRPHIPEKERFSHFAPDMLYYNIYDCLSNLEVFHMLKEEQAGWDWEDAISLEKAVADIVTKQSHRGFNFDVGLAEECIEELDSLMEERRKRVEPLLPKRKATQAFMKEFTPPKIQFRKDGTHSANLLKWIDKHEGKLVSDSKVELFGKEYELPLPVEPLVTEMESTIDDTTHIKEWLVSLGWEPSEWREKDMTLDSKREKLTRERFEQAVDRYVKQTLESSFKDLRCEYLEVRPEKLKEKLLKTDLKGRIYVRMSPSFTVGQEKELCPDLERISENFPYVKDIVEYLTYKHRRNSILGGGLDWEDGEEAERGYLASVREDGRIPTPADTCGAATSRMKHRLVANIPRTTSLYGKKMRGLFGVDRKNFFQLGYDFDSLEARQEAHYCHRYEEAPREYCNSLLQERPHDVHTMMAKRIAEIIGRDFSRDPAKNVKYGCLPTDNTEVLTQDGWTPYEKLEEGTLVLSYNREKGGYEYSPITRLFFYKDAEVGILSNSWFKVEVTEDHEWLVRRRTGKKERYFVEEKKETRNLNTETNIIGSAKSLLESEFSDNECEFIGWLLSDGYFKWSGKKRNRVMGLTISIDQSKENFVKEIRECLEKLGEFKEYSYEDSNMVKFVPNKDRVRELFKKIGIEQGENKHEVNWVRWVSNLSYSNLKAFLKAFWMADGYYSRGTKVITQNNGEIFEAVRLAVNMTGHMVYGNTEAKTTSFSISGSQTVSGQRLNFVESRKTDVFCLSNENETFVVRQNGQITLTGNCTYGAQAAKVAKTIGADLSVGRAVFNAFWEAAKPLSLLKDRLNSYWETQGQKRFILGIDGRKVPTRAAHSILNSLFQSAGVICAKRAMVLHDRKLKEEGLSVDFFKDDWKNREFAQQLIAYHDEAQLELSKSLAKFKRFETREEAQEFKDRQKEKWSDIQESPKGGYFTAYSRVGELASESVREAGEYYGLRVPLTAGYSVGYNWADCH